LANLPVLAKMMGKPGKAEGLSAGKTPSKCHFFIIAGVTLAGFEIWCPIARLVVLPDWIF
jgi:hypothetical protein